MRTFAICLVLGALGCGNDRPPLQMFDAKPKFQDAPVALFDADTLYCDAPSGSAQVTAATTAASSTLTRVHAGGTLESGPVAPTFSSVPMTVDLLFTAADHVPQETLSCCRTAGSACCTLDGVVGSLNTGITTDTAVGTHAIGFTSFQHATFMAQGTLTITSFVQPFDQAPGRIAGTISTTDNSVTGTFDNTFCAAMLFVTI